MKGPETRREPEIRRHVWPVQVQRSLKERRALAAEHRARARAWSRERSREIRELCPAAPQVNNRAPSATKKGPGRVPLSLVVRTRRKPDRPGGSQ